MTKEEAIRILSRPFNMKNVPAEIIKAHELAIKALEWPKTGHWIYSKAVNTDEIRWSECSVCGNGESGCAKRMKYCPNCGAKMEGMV